jgi:flagellin
VVENTTAAESRIRDQEMGQAMVEMAKHNILTQVGQTMLSQANQTQQGVLSLLQ